MQFEIRPITDSNRELVREIISKWPADYIITRARKVYPAEMPAFIAEDSSGKPIGLATYEIIGDQCELVTLDAFEKFSGVGSALLNAVADAARTQSCNRLWLITTNDNLDAIRFYQRRGLTLAAVHVNSLELSRKMKPLIPEIGLHNIPLRDEIEFEMML